MRSTQSILILALLITLGIATAASAEVVTRDVVYQVGDTAHIGYLAYHDSVEGPRSGVIVIHEWYGLNDYPKQRARELAELGYTAFCPDMYGQRQTTTDPKKAGELAGSVAGNPELRDDRLRAAYDTAKEQPEIDPESVAVMGYCFGGTMSLQMAYLGLDLDAVVGVHGMLPAPTPEQAADLDMPILICHGADDKFISAEDQAKFKSAMALADVDLIFIEYANAVHAFTNPAAGDDPSTGVAYNEKATWRSWDHMRQLFAGVL